MSLDETQQPSYHVKATAYDVVPLREKKDVEVGESLKSATSEQTWTRQQKVTNSREEARSLRDSAPHQERDVDDRPQASATLPLPPIRPNKTQNVSAPSKSPSSPAPRFNEESIQESHVRAKPDESQYEGSFPTPPDSGPESVKRPPHPAPVTPSKAMSHRPISHFSPTNLTPGKGSLVRSASNLSLSTSDGSSKRSKNPPRKTQKQMARDSPDSFGEPVVQRRLAPIQVLEGIMAADARDNESLENNEPEQEAEEIRESQPRMGEQAEREVSAITDQQPDFIRFPAKVAESTDASSPLARRPPSPSPALEKLDQASAPSTSPPHQPRFRTLLASGTTSSSAEQSHLFSSQAEGYGATQPSPHPMHFVATQAVSLPARLESPRTPPKPACSIQKPSATRSGSGPSVPLHRRLGPTIPRQESPAVRGNTGVVVPSRSSDHDARTRGLNSPSTPDAKRIRSEAKSTPRKTFHRNDSWISSVANDPYLQEDTYIDEPVASTSHQTSPHRAIVSTPTKASLAGPPRSSAQVVTSSHVKQRASADPNPLRSAPAVAPDDEQSNAATDFEPTFLNQRTLPTLPPSRPTVTKYGTKRNRPAKSFGQAEANESEREDTPIATQSKAAAAPVLDAIDVRYKDGVQKTTAKSPSMASETDSSPAAEDPNDNTYRPPRTDGKERNAKAKTSEGSTAKRPRLKPNRFSGAGLRTLKRSTPLANGATSSLTSLPATSQTFGLRVFGWWASTKAYYPGVISASDGSRFRVDFLDGTYGYATLDRLRLCLLRVGDLIKPTDEINGQKYTELEVEEDWKGGDAPIKVAMKGESVGIIHLKNLYIRQAAVNKSFGDRLVSANLLGDLPPPSSSRRTASPVKTSRPSNVFAGKVFLITSATGESRQTSQDDLRDEIVSHGGRVEDDWRNLLDLPEDGFGSTLHNRDTPFLLAQGNMTIMKPKLMAALAKGIPCIAPEYVGAAVQRVSAYQGSSLTTECRLERVPGICRAIGSTIPSFLAVGRSGLGRPRLGTEIGATSGQAFRR